MQIRKYVVVAGLLGFLAARASYAALEQGWYIAANLGAVKLDTGITNVSGARLDEDTAGVKLLMGYETTEYMAIEGYLANLGTATVTGNAGNSFVYKGVTYNFISSGEVEFNAGVAGIAGKLMLPLTDAFRLYAKAGIHGWAITNNTSTIKDDSGGGVYLGAGADLQLTDTLALTFDYDSYELEETSDMVSVGLQYNF